MNKLAKIVIMIIYTVIILITILNFQEQIRNKVDSSPYYVFDSKFIHTMNNISKDIDGNVETSAFSPHVAYFVSQSYRVESPYGIKSEKELVKIMKKGNFTYLLVFKNFSDIEELKWLFSNKIGDLDEDFQKINNYSTNFYQIYLYKIKGE